MTFVARHSWRSGFNRLLLVILLLLGEAAIAQRAPFDSVLAADLQMELNRQQLIQGFTGISAAAIVPGQGTWLGTSGMSNPLVGDPMLSEMRLGFASITKTYVAAAILSLVEEGTLSLDDQLRQWLPPFARIDSTITIRQLLNHTSGIYNYTDNSQLWNSLFADPNRWWTPEEILTVFVGLPNFPPGTAWGYSNTNYLLLGMILRAATGQDVSTVFRTRLLDPHNLDATFLSGEEAVTGQLATPWFDLDGNGTLDDFSGYFQNAFHSARWTAGGIVSTSEQVALWARALFGGQVLGEAALSEMLTFEPIGDPVWTGYGLGAQRFSLMGLTLYGHAGSILGTLSLVMYSPVLDVSIALAVNDNTPNLFVIMNQLWSIIRTFEPVGTGGTPRAAILPERITLEPNYPNPFNPATTISFRLPRRGMASLKIYNMLGAVVRTLVGGSLPAGRHQRQWNGHDDAGRAVASGIYLYRLEVDGSVETRRMALLK